MLVEFKIKNPKMYKRIINEKFRSQVDKNDEQLKITFEFYSEWDFSQFYFPMSVYIISYAILVE